MESYDLIRGSVDQHHVPALAPCTVCSTWAGPNTMVSVHSTGGQSRGVGWMQYPTGLAPHASSGSGPNLAMLELVYKVNPVGAACSACPVLGPCAACSTASAAPRAIIHRGHRGSETWVATVGSAHPVQPHTSYIQWAQQPVNRACGLDPPPHALHRGLFLQTQPIGLGEFETSVLGIMKPKEFQLIFLKSSRQTGTLISDSLGALVLLQTKYYR